MLSCFFPWERIFFFEDKKRSRTKNFHLKNHDGTYLLEYSTPIPGYVNSIRILEGPADKFAARVKRIFATRQYIEKELIKCEKR